MSGLSKIVFLYKETFSGQTRQQSLSASVCGIGPVCHVMKQCLL